MAAAEMEDFIFKSRITNKDLRVTNISKSKKPQRQ
jgi:hypothetical protein